MNIFELVLKGLSAANLATPQIIAVIGAMKQGKQDGRTDDEIIDHAKAVALETRDITTEDMGDQP